MTPGLLAVLLTFGGIMLAREPEDTVRRDENEVIAGELSAVSYSAIREGLIHPAA